VEKWLCLSLMNVFRTAYILTFLQGFRQTLSIACAQTYRSGHLLAFFFTYFFTRTQPDTKYCMCADSGKWSKVLTSTGEATTYISHSNAAVAEYNFVANIFRVPLLKAKQSLWLFLFFSEIPTICQFLTLPNHLGSLLRSHRIKLFTFSHWVAVDVLC
jgi:hypothetical protein